MILGNMEMDVMNKKSFKILWFTIFTSSLGAMEHTAIDQAMSSYSGPKSLIQSFEQQGLPVPDLAKYKMRRALPWNRYLSETHPGSVHAISLLEVARNRKFDQATIELTLPQELRGQVVVLRKYLARKEQLEVMHKKTLNELTDSQAHELKLLNGLLKSNSFIPDDPYANVVLSLRIVRGLRKFLEPYQSDIIQIMSKDSELSRALRDCEEKADVMLLESIFATDSTLQNLYKSKSNLSNAIDVGVEANFYGEKEYEELKENNLLEAIAILERRDPKKYKNLMVCALNKYDLSSMKFFLEHGFKPTTPISADVYIVENGHENHDILPLHYLAEVTFVKDENWESYKEMVRVLLQHIDINYLNRRGETVLFGASRRQNVKIIQFFLQQGANPKICNNTKGNCLHAYFESIINTFPLGIMNREALFFEMAKQIIDTLPTKDLINQTNSSHCTPFHGACLLYCLPVIQYLIEKYEADIFKLFHIDGETLKPSTLFERMSYHPRSGAIADYLKEKELEHVLPLFHDIEQD